MRCEVWGVECGVWTVVCLLCGLCVCRQHYIHASYCVWWHDWGRAAHVYMHDLRWQARLATQARQSWHKSYECLPKPA